MNEKPSTSLQDTDIEQRLRDAGVTPTRQRVDVARVMLAGPRHLCAEQLMAELARDGCAAPVSKATVYNTLGLFARVGLVREVFADPTRVFYDSNVSDHHHLYDLDSGTLTDIDPEQVEVSAVNGIPGDVEVAGVEVIVRVRRRRG